METSTILEQELRGYGRGYLSKDAFSYLTFFFVDYENQPLKSF